MGEEKRLKGAAVGIDPHDGYRLEGGRADLLVRRGEARTERALKGLAGVDRPPARR